MVVERMAVSVPKELMDEFESTIKERAYTKRSKAIEDAMRSYLSEIKLKKRKGMVIGTISIIYNHHVRGSVEKLTEIQHDYGDIISSNVHMHVNHDICLEVIIVKGSGSRIGELSDSIRSTRGVRYCKLFCTPEN